MFRILQLAKYGTFLFLYRVDMLLLSNIDLPF